MLAHIHAYITLFKLFNSFDECLKKKRYKKRTANGFKDGMEFQIFIIAFYA